MDGWMDGWTFVQVGMFGENSDTPSHQYSNRFWWEKEYDNKYECECKVESPDDRKKVVPRY